VLKPVPVIVRGSSVYTAAGVMLVMVILFGIIDIGDEGPELLLHPLSNNKKKINELAVRNNIFFIVKLI